MITKNGAYSKQSKTLQQTVDVNTTNRKIARAKHFSKIFLAVKITLCGILLLAVFFSSSCVYKNDAKIIYPPANNDESPKILTNPEHNPQPQELYLVTTKYTVEHLFTHNLISHPDIAFKHGNTYGKNLDEDCLTPKEFRAILYELYKNNYALVNVSETFSGSAQSNGEAQRSSFYFPKGKKPLILSFDDVVYARKNQYKGTSSKLIVDKNGEIAAETFFQNGTSRIHGEEFAPILEDFIKNHPDFSYRGARGILFVTGFDGVLGYRTDRNTAQRESEIKAAKQVIKTLKNNGWIFGCHSYAHRHIKKSTLTQVQDDITKWKNEVEPLVGETTLYAYPYGEWEFGKSGNDERQQALKKAGFSMYFGVGNRPFYSKMPSNPSNPSAQQYLFQDRCPMDGISLRKNICSRFFDCAAVYDQQRPLPYN